MGEVIVFPDASAVVVGHLRDSLAARGFPTPVGTRVPNPRPAGRLVVVSRTGGVAANLVVDEAMLTVDCWGDREQDAHDLAQLCRALVRAAAGSVLGGVAVYRVVEVGGPQNLPDPLSASPRYLFTLMVGLRGVAV